MKAHISVAGILRRAKITTLVVAIAGVLLSIGIGLVIAGTANVIQVFLVIFALAGFMIAFIRIDLAVLGMIVIIYSQTYLIVGERYGITDVVQGLIMLLALAAGTRWLLYGYEYPEKWMRPLALISFYCLIGLASVLVAGNQDVALYLATETIKSGIIALIIAVLITRYSSLRLIVWGLLATGIFLGFLTVYQYITGSYDNDYGGYAHANIENISGDVNDYRAGGPVEQPNAYAQIMLVLIPIALDRVWEEKKSLLRLLAGIALGLSSFSVILTYSRTGFLVLVAVFAMTLLVFRRGQFRYFFTVIVLSLILVYILPSRFTDRIRTLTELVPSNSNSGGAVQDYSFRGRNSEMIVALQMVADHPILGVGLGNFSLLYQKYAQRVGLEFRSEARYAHSLYLEVASETGLLGFASFLLLVGVTISSGWKAKNALLKAGLKSQFNMSTAILISFLGYLLAAITMHSVYPRNFWVLIGIAMALPRVADVEIGILKNRSNYPHLYRADPS